jgi:hypothetical protein
MVQPFFSCAASHSIEPGWARFEQVLAWWAARRLSPADLNRASPWFYSSMRRGYARGVTRRKQAEKRDMTNFPRGKSKALVPRY